MQSIGIAGVRRGHTRCRTDPHALTPCRPRPHRDVGWLQRRPHAHNSFQLANDPCSGQNQASCTGSCEWIAVGMPCEAGEPCISGVCATPDPCRAHGDEASCAGAGCAWAGIAGLCPSGTDCDNGGFCYTPTDDNCACACPAFCPPGEICPPCACDRTRCPDCCSALTETM